MLFDKKMAIKGGWRISEKHLFLIACFLGSVGIITGMYSFRHKTKHLKFTIGIPILFIVNIISIILIVKYYFLI